MKVHFFRRWFLCIVITVILSGVPFTDTVSAGDNRRVGLSLWPGMSIPLGADSRSINSGLSGALGAEYRLSTLPGHLGVDGHLGYATIDGVGAISSVSAFVVAGTRLGLLPRVRIAPTLFVGAGWNTLRMASSEEESISRIALGYGATVGIEVPLNDGIALGIRAGYLAHSNTYNGLLLSAGTIISLPSSSRTTRPSRPRSPDRLDDPVPVPLVLDDVRFDTLFPVFYKHYDENPLGRATLVNGGSSHVSGITMRLQVPRFMDVPRTQTVPAALAPGEQTDIDLFALLTDDVLRITEGTRVAVRIDVTFSYEGEVQEYTLDRSLEIINRNAMTWDDDRKAASFVTARDPVVLTMARNAAALVRSGGFEAVNVNVRTAIALTETLREYGVAYVVDPASPYADLSGKPHAVDFLQFPRQTLEYRAGDCDDLSILYAALLEAVGVPAAFITVPGHIFVAFDCGVAPDEARTIFSREDEVIVLDGRVWVPVEVTILDEGFLQAWQSGARQWREHNRHGKAHLYPLEEAWQRYPPVGLPDAPPRIDTVAADAVTATYRTQLTRFIDREIYPQVSRLQSLIAGGDGNPRHINRLGVLYARHGFTDRAHREFERVASLDPPFAPALVNLGNLAFLERDMDRALRHYSRAQELVPDSPAVLLAVARSHHELENYGMVSRTYGRLKTVDPDLAAEYSYLDFRGDDGHRAAHIAEMAGRVVWDD